MAGVRQIAAFVVVFTFILFFFSSGIYQQSNSVLNAFSDTENEFPDFGQYKFLRTLSAQEFPIDDPGRRVIIIGDIHGSDTPFHALLSKLYYDSNSDTLIHVGDFLAKGAHHDSLSVLSYMASNNIIGVRGNHDQKIVEWHAWMDWVLALPGGESFLDDLGDQQPDNKEQDTRNRNSKWWKLIPKGWKVYSDHYRIARSMSSSEYTYLLSLPLMLHIPSAHAYIAHAGLLSSDPHYKPSNRHQPLANLPVMPSGLPHDGDQDLEELMRLAQEEGIMHDVMQNKDPWVVLNMRGVRKDETVTRKGKKGTPWSDLWNSDMERCAGFDSDLQLPDAQEDTESDNLPLPCMPATVIYGHAAARGVDVKRWSIGLDSGCVYGRRLTALVLGPDPPSNPHFPRQHDSDDTDEDLEEDFDDKEMGNAKSKPKRPPPPSEVSFGDTGRARIVSVRCH